MQLEAHRTLQLFQILQHAFEECLQFVVNELRACLFLTTDIPFKLWMSFLKLSYSQYFSLNLYR